MGNIKVTIPAQEYSHNKYSDGCNCYLAQALKSAGHEDVKIGMYGETRIGNNYYKPVGTFDSRSVKESFSNNQSIDVELEPSSWDSMLSF